MPLALASVSYDAKRTISGTIAFLRLRQMNEVLHDLLIMGCHWCWYLCNMKPMVSSMAPLHSLDQDDQNEVEHNFLFIDTDVAAM